VTGQPSPDPSASSRPFDVAQGRPERVEGRAESRGGQRRGAIGIVVQRYGADINGGAELHARYIAEHLAKHVQVEVLTTCAEDYISWRNALQEGREIVNGVPVRRFAVTRERDPADFGRHSERVFGAVHAVTDELKWLDAEGPTSPALIEYLRTHEKEFDFFLFFSFRYYHAYHGVRTVPAKAILVPTAERDGALGLSIFGGVFRSVRALMYNSFEERALIHAVSGNTDVPGVVVGVGSDIPRQTHPHRFRQKFQMQERFAIYIGRIDENKGCAQLFEYFQRYSQVRPYGLRLVLVGAPIIEIPNHPKIRHLGFLSDEDKFDALAAAELLIMPSYFESLSMVALEAWALGKPVLANGQCDVLKGQCIRSNGGLYYDDLAEFIETLRAIDTTPSLAATLGRNGRDYFNRHYTWPIIEQKYLDMFERLKGEPSGRPLEPLPNWFMRRRQSQPPANDVIAKLPKGAALETREPPHPVREALPPPAATVTASPRHGAPVSTESGSVSAERRPISSEPSTPLRAHAIDPGRVAQRRDHWRGDRPGPRGPRRRRRPGGRPPRRSGS
jgi:glycosyltransferase involved in cell wall biosynthesis